MTTLQCVLPVVISLNKCLLLLLAAQAMDAVWGEGDQVQVIHPAAACIAGRAMVSVAVRGQESWRRT
jgi:hypothetical protein